MLIGWLGRQMLPLLEEDSGGGGGEIKPRVADVAARYGGDTIRMAEQIVELEREAFKTRDKIRDRDTRIKELEAKQVPDGATVLSAADAERWQAYTALGKPDEVKAKLTSGSEAETKAATLERKDTLRQVAEVAGFKPDALQDFDQLAGGLTYLTKDETETVQGRQMPVKRVYVSQDGKDTPLVDYVTATKPHMMPALKAEAAAPAPVPPGTPPRDVRRPAPAAESGPSPIPIRL